MPFKPPVKYECKCYDDGVMATWHECLVHGHHSEQHRAALIRQQTPNENVEAMLAWHGGDAPDGYRHT